VSLIAPALVLIFWDYTISVGNGTQDGARAGTSFIAINAPWLKSRGWDKSCQQTFAVLDDVVHQLVNAIG